MAYENRKVCRVAMQERIKKFGLIHGQERGVKIGHRFVHIMCDICQLVGGISITITVKVPSNGLLNNVDWIGEFIWKMSIDKTWKELVETRRL